LWDQCSLPFIVLVFLLLGICLYSAGMESNTLNYVGLVFGMIILLFILFLSWNIFVFVVHYELLVIVLFIILFLLIVSFFRVRAAFYFFIFSLLGSIFFFYIIAIIPVFVKAMVISIAVVFAIPFLIKLPSFPFSYWLPEVHCEANTSISVILAGLILKLGIFGIMRYCYITFDLFFSILNSGLLTLTLIIILVIMCSFFRFVTDLKKIIAFSSVVHLNLTFSALITLNNSGILTAIITSFAHGLSSVGLFIFVGTVISRTYTRNIDSLFFLDFQSRCLLLFLLLCNLSFPATLNFYGEILSVVSLISISSFYVIVFMITSLVFTLLWFFIYNRKLPFAPIRFHFIFFEKRILVWLLFMLYSSGIFLLINSWSFKKCCYVR
jgi:NADH:ubiquinone oxidoreductase subunit 4 (subunit M)